MLTSSPHMKSSIHLRKKPLENNLIITMTLQVICIPTQNTLLKCAVHFHMKLSTFSTSFVKVRVTFQFECQLSHK